MIVPSAASPSPTLLSLPSAGAPSRSSPKVRASDTVAGTAIRDATKARSAAGWASGSTSARASTEASTAGSSAALPQAAARHIDVVAKNTWRRLILRA